MARPDLDAWLETLPQPRTIAMEATIFSGWIYDHLLPHASAIKVAHPLMLRAIAAAKKKNDKIDASKIADCLRCDFLPECHMASTEIRDRRRILRYRHLVVKQMVQTKNRVSGLLMETGVEHTKSRLHKVGYFRRLMTTNNEIEDSIRPLLRLSRETIERCQKTEYALVSSLERDPLLKERIRRLRTVPGVGPITALNWALEMGDISRFRSIKQAVSYCEFVPFFQPVVALHTGEVAGVEVLARWQHRILGIVPPAEFIAIAEQEGLIGRLTAMLVSKAFTAARMLPDPQWLAFNISPHLLRDPALPRQIREAAEAAGFPLHRVVIEITESALVEHLEQAEAITKELKADGCRLALGDFGTGYSSLLHLQSLPFDELKVDRSFVGSMTERRESRKIVSAVVSLGQSLGLTTVAEGVETEEQAEMLLLLGCEMAQGWLFGKAVPADELSVAIAARSPRFALHLSARLWRDIAYPSPPGQRLAQLQALYDHAPVGLSFLSPELRYISINQALAAKHRVPAHEHLGRSVAEVVPEIYFQVVS